MIRTVVRNGKDVKQQLRICKKCGSKDWVAYRKGVMKTLLCADCATDKLRHTIPICQEKTVPPQDEEANRRMIDEFLARRAS